MSEQETFEPFPGTDAEMFIQWKGTNVCLDFDCPCGTSSHFDGWFAYALRCAACGSIFEMGTQVLARRVETHDCVVDLKPHNYAFMIEPKDPS